MGLLLLLIVILKWVFAPYPGETGRILSPTPGGYGVNPSLIQQVRW